MHRVEEAVVIIGAGLAGLACARRITEVGVPCRLLEADDAVGGRVRTDELEGFRLDRGFQVLLTAYPETRRLLDYEALDLRPFVPGALVRYAGRFHRLADPWRSPLAAIAALGSPVGSLADKLRVATLRSRALSGSLEELQARPERTTIEVLETHGFSPSMIERFFRPLLGGVFLESDLTTSSRKLEFVLRMFSSGDTALPASGMGAIADQLAARLPDGVIRLRSPVARLETGRVILESGEALSASAIVVATREPAAARLLGRSSERRWHQVTCLYYAAPRPPISEPILVLDGDGRGPVNNLCVPSVVSPSYAPTGSALVSATVLGVPEEEDGELDTAVRAQLSDWFGPIVETWRLLRVDRIREALPDQSLSAGGVPAADTDGARVGSDLYVCGDYLDTASINGALASGGHAAEAVIADRG